jgi:hypothetical protein
MSSNKRLKSHADDVISILSELSRNFPAYNLARHLSTALEGYGDIWGMTNKEFLYALNKYKIELELDNYSSSDDDIDNIIKQGMNLNTILDDEEEED